MASLRPDHLERPLPQRYSPRHRGFDEGMRRHAMAVTTGRPAYLDPISGLAVFTAAFLAERGWCCTSGCRHCPFVPESPRPAEPDRRQPPPCRSD